jgi:hypothetical protein
MDEMGNLASSNGDGKILNTRDKVALPNHYKYKRCVCGGGAHAMV